MPVPSLITDLSTTAGSNSPAGSESPALIDDYLRAHASFIAGLRDGTGLANGAVSAAKLADSNVTTAKIANNNVTPAKLSNTGYELGMRNRIINGNMRIDQRSSGAAVSVTTSTYTLDRWWTYRPGGSTGVFSVQSDGSITHPSDFTHAAKLTVTTADTTLSGTDEYLFMQYVEGFNVADIKFGSAAAKPITVSFWSYCSRAGTYGLSVKNATNDRSYPTSYTVNAANTWEYKTINIPGCTTGTWDKTTGAGLALVFCLGTAPSYKTTGNAWATGNYNGATVSEDLISTAGATLYITGVQLEAGSTTTPFEFRPYGTELALCQRYYSVSIATCRGPSTGAGTVYNSQCYFPAEMRVSPTVVQSGGVLNNCTASTPFISTSSLRFEITATASGDSYAINRVITASAEI